MIIATRSPAVNTASAEDRCASCDGGIQNRRKLRAISPCLIAGRSGSLAARSLTQLPILAVAGLDDVCHVSTLLCRV